MKFAQLAVLLGISEDDGFLHAPFGNSFTMELYEEQGARMDPNHYVRFVGNDLVLHCPTSMRTPPQDLMSKRLGLGLCSSPRLRPSLVRQVPTTKDCSMGVPSAGTLPPRRP